MITSRGRGWSGAWVNFCWVCDAACWQATLQLALTRRVQGLDFRPGTLRVSVIMQISW